MIFQIKGLLANLQRIRCVTLPEIITKIVLNISDMTLRADNGKVNWHDYVREEWHMDLSKTIQLNGEGDCPLVETS